MGMWKHCRCKFRLSNQISRISSYKLTVCSSEFVSSHVLSKAPFAVTSGHVASRAWHPKLAMTVLPEPVLKTCFNHKSSKNVHLSKSVISKQRLSTSNQGNVFLLLQFSWQRKIIFKTNDVQKISTWH